MVLACVSRQAKNPGSSGPVDSVSPIFDPLPLSHRFATGPTERAKRSPKSADLTATSDNASPPPPPLALSPSSSLPPLPQILRYPPRVPTVFRVLAITTNHNPPIHQGSVLSCCPSPPGRPPRGPITYELPLSHCPHHCRRFVFFKPTRPRPATNFSPTYQLLYVNSSSRRCLTNSPQHSTRIFALELSSGLLRRLHCAY